ncbi:hypothetical protein M1446_04160 [Candidatus Dependentiae bacterium]|nr:hypothetical protein [Candidatus Dependentiae bacterium]
MKIGYLLLTSILTVNLLAQTTRQKLQQNFDEARIHINQEIDRLQRELQDINEKYEAKWRDFKNLPTFDWPWKKSQVTGAGDFASQILPLKLRAEALQAQIIALATKAKGLFVNYVGEAKQKVEETINKLKSQASNLKQKFDAASKK